MRGRVGTEKEEEERERRERGGSGGKRKKVTSDGTCSTLHITTLSDYLLSIYIP